MRKGKHGMEERWRREMKVSGTSEDMRLSQTSEEVTVC